MGQNPAGLKVDDTAESLTQPWLSGVTVSGEKNVAQNIGNKQKNEVQESGSKKVLFDEKTKIVSELEVLVATPFHVDLIHLRYQVQR